MSDRNRDPHPDSTPENDTDRRSDIEKAVEARGDDAERAGTDAPADTIEGIGGENGAGGVVKNQDDMQQ